MEKTIKTRALVAFLVLAMLIILLQDSARAVGKRTQVEPAAEPQSTNSPTDGITNFVASKGLKITSQPEERSNARLSIDWSPVIKDVKKEGIRSKFSQGVLCKACGSPGELGLVKELLDVGVPIMSRDSSQQTPLHCSVLSHDEELVKLLLAKGAQHDALDAGGFTPQSSAEWLIKNNPNNPLGDFDDLWLHDYVRLLEAAN